MGLPGRHVKYVECSADGRQEFVVTAVLENPARPFAFSIFPNGFNRGPQIRIFFKGFKGQHRKIPIQKVI